MDGEQSLSGRGDLGKTSTGHGQGQSVKRVRGSEAWGVREPGSQEVKTKRETERMEEVTVTIPR